MDKNKNIEMITGDPKKAMNKLAFPIIASLLLIFANNIIDSIWVAGLGAESLAAIGYIAPLFMILIGIGNGIGTGGNSLISRYIGAENRSSANNAAIHNFILGIIISVMVSTVLLIFLKPLLNIMGASSVLNYAMEYGTVIFTFAFAILMPSIISGAFRAEGDVKRSTALIVFSAVINMILDPIFIFSLNLRVAGAAWATIIANTAALALMLYWMFIKKDTYLKYSHENFKNDLIMYKDILVVGIPASFEQLMLSSLTIAINFMLTMTSGPVAVAVYTAGWRIINIGILPTIGIGTAAISVAGVAYGSEKYKNLRVALRYAVKVAFIVSLIICILVNLFANSIAFLFSYSQTSAQLEPLIAGFLQIMCLFILYVPFGTIPGNIFQGVGKGTTSFILTSIRGFFLVLIFSYLLGFVFNLGEYGIYYGILLGGAIGSLIAYIAIELYINKRIKGCNED